MVHCLVAQKQRQLEEGLRDLESWPMFAGGILESGQMLRVVHIVKVIQFLCTSPGAATMTAASKWHFIVKMSAVVNKSEALCAIILALQSIPVLCVVAVMMRMRNDK